jgi:hypothetical protein
MTDFWLNKPSQLFRLQILPSSSLTNGERLNAVSRLIIIITIILFIFWREEGHWWRFLLAGALIVIVLYFSIRCKDKDFIRE